ncbi:MAG: hypothetical protein AB8B91_12140 [Rubripirellula sp.]
MKSQAIRGLFSPTFTAPLVIAVGILVLPGWFGEPNYTRGQEQGPTDFSATRGPENAFSDRTIAPTQLPTSPMIQGRPGRDVAGSGDLIGFSHVDDSGTQVISLVNAQKMWMAVYHIGSDGAIRLVSSRAIDADFTLQLNATEPTPEQIRRIQDR